MPNKTPYELRFDVLQMARDLEMQRYEQLNYPFWQLHGQIEDVIADIKDGATSTQMFADLVEMVHALKDSIPEMPTPDQIKARASELYEFVERKPSKG